MALNIEALLNPISGESRVGQDLCYDAERSAIESAFETSVSTTDRVESGTNWRDIIKLIEAQSLRTKDIWLPVYLMRAGAKMGNLDTVVLGAQYLAGLVEGYWEDVHPQLEEYGYQGRKTPIESLTKIAEFLGPLKTIKLVEHPRLGSYSSADMERFSLNGEAEPNYGMFLGALKELMPEDSAVILQKIDDIKAHLSRVDLLMTANIQGETSVNFKDTYDALSSIRKALSQYLPEGFASESGSEIAEKSEIGSSAAPSRNSAMVSSIESRDQVIFALDAISDYYRRKEPTSPVPLVLKRAREWVSVDFLTLLEDIAPNMIDDARRVLSSNLNKPEGDY